MRPRMEEERIYEAAIPFFAKFGYKKTTLEDIAGALDMSNTNLYSYAKSKQALYKDCVSYALDRWHNFVLAETEDIEDPKEKLLMTFRSAVGYIAGNEDMSALIKNDPSIFPMYPDVDPLNEFTQWPIQYVRQIMVDGIESGAFRAINVDVAATMLFGWYKYIILSSLEMKDLDRKLLEETLTTMSTLLFDGLLLVPEDN
ncbi:MAG: TetR/AcrR family transcriptional regulator [Clostridia bacterium]|nr:TetR/AcrR family transcriptional regulator [Clostridia bacterium]